MFHWISILTLTTALLFGAQTTALAQSSDAGEASEQATQAEAQDQRGFWTRTWDRMRGRGNPNTEAGQQFHEEKREQQEAEKTRREQAREARGDERGKAESRSNVDEEDRDRVKKTKKTKKVKKVKKVKKAKKVKKTTGGGRGRGGY